MGPGSASHHFVMRRVRDTVAATFEGEFPDVTRSYADKAVVRYVW
jgi:hypothetical protein